MIVPHLQFTVKLQASQMIGSQLGTIQTAQYIGTVTKSLLNMADIGIMLIGKWLFGNKMIYSSTTSGPPSLLEKA